MKKLISYTLALAAMVSLTVVAYAAQKTFTATESLSKVSISGTAFSPKDASGKDLPLVEINGVLYVPAKPFTEAMGKYYEADTGKNTVNIIEKVVTVGGGSSSASSKPATPSASGVTTGQKNAVAKAKSYLDMMPFSYDGLKKQLEFEKFSSADAKYAVDNCGANWNEQAVKKAKSYLEYTSFSREGLIEQLEYEGFTNAQAVYGVEANGY